MTELPMFPLGSVLFPHMPLQLRVFEDRYLVMLAEILSSDTPEFGVVLIERGQEVGGGEHRFPVGTVAKVTELEAYGEFVGLVAEGGRRFEVLEWLDDDPYPRASIRYLDDLNWDDSLDEVQSTATRDARRALAVASEFDNQRWAASVELSDDPVAASWQLAGIAPLGALDQQSLLAATSMQGLLEGISESSREATATMGSGFSGIDDDDFDWNAQPGDQ